jgi:hypothetical protein
MWLVLCHTNDASALWAFNGLKARGMRPIELVTAETLAFSLRWEHRIGANGTSIRIELPDGRVLDNERIHGVLNRIQFVPMSHWRWASDQERDYVQQETYAFYTSWLNAFSCPILNPATPLGLCGAWLSEARWLKLAAQVNLPVPAYTSDSARPICSPQRTVLVAGTAVEPAGLPAVVEEGCRKLACLSETPLLAIGFSLNPDGAWEFRGANPVPDLRAFGEKSLDCIQAGLEKAGAEL